jgi:hypothetical protein
VALGAALEGAAAAAAAPGPDAEARLAGERDDVVEETERVPEAGARTGAAKEASSARIGLRGSTGAGERSADELLRDPATRESRDESEANELNGLDSGAEAGAPSWEADTRPRDANKRLVEVAAGAPLRTGPTRRALSLTGEKASLDEAAKERSAEALRATLERNIRKCNASPSNETSGVREARGRSFEKKEGCRCL